MEYLPRGDLKARIQRGVSEQDALHYLVQIASRAAGGARGGPGAP